MQDIAEKARLAVEKLNKSPRNEFFLTTSQLRKFLAAVVALQNRVQAIDGDELGDEIVEEVKYLKIKAAYQAGRSRDVKDFLDKSDLVKEIDKIGNSKKAFMSFSKYVEGLIAYHKYYGGKE